MGMYVQFDSTCMCMLLLVIMYACADRVAQLCALVACFMAACVHMYV